MFNEARRHYVDLGAHWGEALEEALKPAYRFTTLWAIEPSQMALKELRKFRDSRLRIEGWGAWNADSKATLHSAGSVGASLYPDKHQHWMRSEIVLLKDVLSFFNTTFNSEDEIYLKINIEGAELTVLRHLLTGESSGWKVSSLLLSIDLPKVPSLRDHESELLSLLANSQLSFQFRSDRNPDIAVRAWLSNQLTVDKNVSRIERLRYLYELPPRRILRKALRSIVPSSIWLLLANKIGPNRRKRFSTQKSSGRGVIN
jgi:FkbM family methyltransferase